MLEALLATTLLATAGLGWIALASQAAFAVEMAHGRETAVAAAEVVLARLEVHSRLELEAMAGRRRIEGRGVRVTKVDANLFLLEVAVEEPAGDWLATHVYRPPEVRGEP